jgi:hypothetical protein
MNEESSEGPGSRKGSFNKAIEFLKGLQVLENICSESSINNDFETWFHTMNAWFNKLCGKLDAKRQAEFINAFNRIEVLVYNEGVPDSFKKNSLNTLQRELEKLMDEFGYQMPEMSQDDEPLDFT